MDLWLEKIVVAVVCVRVYIFSQHSSLHTLYVILFVFCAFRQCRFGVSLRLLFKKK